MFFTIMDANVHIHTIHDPEVHIQSLDLQLQHTLRTLKSFSKIIVIRIVQLSYLFGLVQIYHTFNHICKVTKFFSFIVINANIIQRN